MHCPGLTGNASRAFLNNAATYIATKPVPAVGCDPPQNLPAARHLCQLGLVVGPLAKIVTQRIYYAISEDRNLELQHLLLREVDLRPVQSIKSSAL
eukprot:scaffold109021_cov26-Prasinocladus_malaysianus.AAC.1